jgi:hypothetical protein
MFFSAASNGSNGMTEKLTLVQTGARTVAATLVEQMTSEIETGATTVTRTIAILVGTTTASRCRFWPGG